MTPDARDATPDNLRGAVEALAEECDGAICHENVLGEQVVTVRWLRERLTAILDRFPAAPSEEGR